MLTCPLCANKDFWIDNGDDDYNDSYLNETLADEDRRNKFFKEAKQTKCQKCGKTFVSSCCIFTKIIIQKHRNKGLQQGPDYDTPALAEEKRQCSLTTEKFAKLQEMFASSDNLLNYLPTEDLKERYNDAKKIINNNVSDKAKIGIIRPLVEAFLNHENKEEENNKIREAIKTLGKNNKELSKALHKIVDDTLKGVHIKPEELNNDPKSVFFTLEALFTKLYLMPKEEEKIKEEFENKKQALEARFQSLLDNLK